MKLVYTTQDFEAQLMRALSYTYYGGADIGECLTTAHRIEDGNRDSWYEEWMLTAERLYHAAIDSEKRGHYVSACESFLKASNYYRTAFHFLYGSEQESKLLEGYEKHVHAFDRAIQHFAVPVEQINIPYDAGSITGHFYHFDHTDIPRPIIIANGGYDSTHQEGYFWMAAAALRRGYHVLCFDGPGQGEQLFRKKIPMRYNWETVITPIVDFLMQRNDVDHSRIILVGQSWGGYLAPRAAAFEKRIAALVANPGLFDAMESLKINYPEIEEMLEEQTSAVLSSFLTQAMSNKMLAHKFKSKMWVHQVDTALDLLKEWKKYRLDGVAAQIECPCLIADSENEPYSSGQAKELYEALKCRKEYLLFTSDEGAGEHCEAGALSLYHQRALDWLDALTQEQVHAS